MSSCPAFGNGAGGVAEALRAVDCHSALAVESAFSRLFGVDGALGQALGLALTLYVGLLAVSLLTGRSTLSLSALTPRMLGLGLALTFATSWTAYNNVVWNLLVGAPDQVASLLMGTRGSATELFASRLDGLFSVIAQAAQAAQAAAAGNATGAPAGGGLTSPIGLLNLSALMLLLSSVGVLIVARIALAAMLALGPIFIVLALFRGTRGLFEGWLKTSVLFAVVPLISVLVGGAALSMLTPVVRELAMSNGVVPPQLAVTVFLGAFVHLALSVLAFKAAASLTSGWRLPFHAEAPGKGETNVEAAAAASLAAAPLIGETGGAHASAVSTGADADRARAVAAEASRPRDGAAAAAASSSSDRVVIPFPGARADAGLAGPASDPQIGSARSQGLAQRFRAPGPAAKSGAASSALTRELRP